MQSTDELIVSRPAFDTVVLLWRESGTLKCRFILLAITNNCCILYCWLHCTDSSRILMFIITTITTFGQHEALHSLQVLQQTHKHTHSPSDAIYELCPQYK